MSHASGAIKINDEIKYYYEYDGTSDFALSKIYKTLEELRENWRKDNCRDCTCENPNNVEVGLLDNYGSEDFEHFIYSTICEKCMAITGKRHEWEY